VSDAGAGLRLLPGEQSADAIADHVRKLLPWHGNPGHRDAARTIAEEIARTPSPEEVARALPEYAGRA
jgi:UDP:flavonoid glycosyltransferase YjiC (YdhE family)